MSVLLRRLILAAGALAAISTAAGAQTVAHNIGENARQFGGGERLVPPDPDPKVELALKIKQPFTVVGVGDFLQFQPFASSNDPDVQYLLDVIRKADLAVGDLENEVRDFDAFGHLGNNLATKEVADDWARMGIDMMSRANNQDQSDPGVWEDLRQVERVGIVHVGVARTLAEARMPRYLATPKGLAGFAGFYAQGGVEQCCLGGRAVYVTAAQLAQVKAIKASYLARRPEVEVPVPTPKPDPADSVDIFGLTFRVGPKPAAEPPPEREPEPGARDGVMNTLHLTRFYGVTADQLAQLRAIAGDKGSGPDLKAFGTQFRLMDKPGGHSFDMDPRDRREILEQIRTGKQAADIMVTNAHWHQNRYDFQSYSYDHFPPEFEVSFAHDAIDNGDDVFIAQGVHTLRGVEIYKGKPIFYGTSSFVWQSAIKPVPKGKATSVASPEVVRPEPAALRDPTVIVGEQETQNRTGQLRSNLEAIIAYSHFENGKLAEVRIYPVDTGQTPRPGSQVGIPRRPTPEVARKILEEVIEYSRPFGTRIEVRDGVGIIRAPEG